MSDTPRRKHIYLDDLTEAQCAAAWRKWFDEEKAALRRQKRGKVRAQLVSDRCVGCPVRAEVAGDTANAAKDVLADSGITDTEAADQAQQNHLQHARMRGGMFQNLKFLFGHWLRSLCCAEARQPADSSQTKSKKEAA